MRYYLGAEARLRRSVEDTAMSVFAGWSYEEVLTPTVDYYALFEQGMGPAEAQSSFRFTDNDGRLLSLRPDVTSSVARVAATLLAEQERPLRLCYAAPVFRQQPQSHAEWRRENTQLGCELIGTNGRSADLEVLLLASEILKRIGLTDNFCITINDVGVLNGLLAEVDVDPELSERLRKLIDTRDQTELARLLSSSQIPNNLQTALKKLPFLTGKANVLDEARRLVDNRQTTDALDRLGELWQVIKSLSLESSFEIDLADVSSLDYYSGLSFKIFVRGAGYRVGRGGRYDTLTASFGNAEPAVGFVLNLDSLVEVIGRNSIGNGKQSFEVLEVSVADVASTFREAIAKRTNNETIRISLNQ
jgi:ATP phosphoribosyltransferase regulatory subunit